MLAEREAYLKQLIGIGHNRKFLTERAWMLCHVARLLTPAQGERISEAAVSTAALKWLGEPASQPWHRKRSQDSQFKAVARSWFVFLGRYAPPTLLSERFSQPLDTFRHALREEFSYLESSINSCVSSVTCFLVWISQRRDSVSTIRLQDVDDFFTERRASGRSHRTVVAYARSLRVFFRYAEQRGWSDSTLSKTIKTPALRQVPGEVGVPRWLTVRRMIRRLDDLNASQCRAKAVLLLASVYGLRCSEIIRLTLDDLDWGSEVMIVRRSKRGKTQQFPLQREVGDAITQYLRTVRQPSRFREVFLTLHFPHRPALNLGPAMRKILNAQRLFSRSVGMHSLRHACATELLKKGTSLRGIADFLGHRSLNSVSVYAHCSPDALRAVAAFDLEQVL